MARFIGISTINGAKGEHKTPYMTRVWIGRLRLHIFYRGDADPDCHDHPWDFWTFPLTSYVEETYTALVHPDGSSQRHIQVVPAWRLTFRPAEHTHRVLGRYGGQHYGYPLVDNGKKIVTIVWQGRVRREWGFLRHRDGKWCWTHWKDYVFGGGKHAPCEQEKEK